MSFVVSMNLKRRQLTESQKAMVAAAMLPMLEEEAKARMLSGKADPAQKVAGGEAREQAAKITGTNRQYVSDAKKLKREAPEIAEHVRAGRVSIPEAKILAEAEPEERREIVRRLDSGEKVNVRKAVAKKPRISPRVTETKPTKVSREAEIRRTTMMFCGAIRTIIRIHEADWFQLVDLDTDDEIELSDVSDAGRLLIEFVAKAETA